MRSVLIPIAALAATPGVAALLPLAADHPLRSTIAMIPAVFVAAASVESWIGRHHLAPLPMLEVKVLTGLLALLTMLALGSRSLGLAIAEAMIVGALFLLLFFWLGRVLVRLRPLLGARLGLRPPAVFFWLPLIAYLAILPWGTQQRPPDGDEPFYLLVAHSIVHDLDTNLANNYRQRDYLEFVDRELQPQLGDLVDGEESIQSRHAPLFPLLIAPLYAIGGKLGVQLTIAVTAAALAWLTLRVCCRYYPQMPAEALLTYALVALSPPLLIYSHQVWVELPAALLALLTFDAIGGLAIDRPLGRQKTVLARAVLPLFVLPLLNLRFAPLAVGLLALLLWRKARQFKVLLWLTAAFAALAAVVLGYNQVVHGHALRAERWSMLISSESPHTALGGLFLDAGFGLFAAAPIWLLLVPAAALALRRREPIVLDLALSCVAYFAVLSTASGGWYGGWSPPFRLGLVALPLLAIPVVPLLRYRHRAGARFCIAVLAGATMILALLWIVSPGLAYDWADGTMRLTENLGHRFGTDVGRLVPSFVRPRAANWVWSLVAIAVGLLWWWPRSLGRASAGLLGAAALLLALAAGGGGAARLATIRVHFEDSFVVKLGGDLRPGRWVETQDRRGWALGAGDQLAIPVVAGGRQLELTIEVRQLEPDDRSPARLLLRATGATLDEVEIPPRHGWQTLHLGPYDWRSEDDLELQLSSDETVRGREVIFDRMRLKWR